MKYLLSFTISTEADPSLLLDLLQDECAPSFVENLDSMHDQSAELDEDSPTVEGQHLDHTTHRPCQNFSMTGKGRERIMLVEPTKGFFDAVARTKEGEE